MKVLSGDLLAKVTGSKTAGETAAADGAALVVGGGEGVSLVSSCEVV